jgi:hypothetical protein
VTLSISERLPEDDQEGPKHVAIDVIIMPFLIKKIF